MVQKLRQRMGREEGFTLVELLVVMLILGLLAAIAIPSFFNQRDKARDADAKAQVRSAQTAMETWATDNGGSYNTPAPTAADLGGSSGIESTIEEARLTITAGAGTYTVTMASENTPNTFSISRAADGTVTYPCATAGNDGCPTGGWGG